MNVAGDVVHKDPERAMKINFEATTLRGAITGKGVHIKMDPASKWTATADSKVTIVGGVDLGQIDALKDITISAIGGENGSFVLASGGTLTVIKD